MLGSQTAMRRSLVALSPLVFAAALAACSSETPPATPTAAPAPPPPSSYMVFFDWNKSVLTSRAQQIVGEAAGNAAKGKATQIAVNGYTDTSGTARYNEGLSMRRAQAVAAELVRDGVPKTALVIKGFGETHLMVPTGPNVREPQNRRVEIIMH